jgi:hypothetical protein
MMLPPSPMDVYEPGLFRIAGFGGAALFLRSGVVNGGGPHLVVDVGLLAPDDYGIFLRRPMVQGLSDELARFFFACASDMNPELTVSSVQDPQSGLEIRVLSSTDGEVELEVQMRGEDADGINFLTSRVALTQAADDVRVLEAAVADDVRPVPPMDW